MKNKITYRPNPWFYIIWGLTIFMFVLKTLGIGIVADWSWWIVFSPVLIPLALGLLLIVIGAILSIIFYMTS